jgi:hypothetical protein
MTAPRHPIPRPASRPAHGHRIPASIWLPEDPQPTRPTGQRNPSALLPIWALDRIRTEFCNPTNRPDAPTRMLLHTALGDIAPGMDARARCTPLPAALPRANGAGGRSLVLLAELLTPTSAFHDADPGDGEEGWPGFFHRAHRLLLGGGLLLTASRQHHGEGRLADPCGALIACARTAGFSYLQHVIVVHATITGDQLTPDPDAPNTAPQEHPVVHRLLHTDLLAFHAPASGH